MQKVYVPSSSGLSGLGLSFGWTTISSCMSAKMQLFPRLTPIFNSHPALGLLSCWSILTRASSVQYWTQRAWACFGEILIPRKEIKLCFFPSTGLAGKTPATGWGYELLVTSYSFHPFFLSCQPGSNFFFKESHSTYHQVLPLGTILRLSPLILIYL